MQNLSVVLCRPKYSENVGATARAGLNMGCSRLILVNPRELDMQKALALGTPRSRAMLESMRVVDGLSEALADCHAAIAATARIRPAEAAPLGPGEAADAAAGFLQRSMRVAAVFGPEDSGLTTGEIRRCTHLVTIPAAPGAPSLNLAQAVLLILYEIRGRCNIPGPPQRHTTSARCAPATREEHGLLFERIEQALLDIGFLDSGNPGHFMGRMRRLVNRMELRRKDLDLLLGICRRIRNLRSRLDDQGTGPG